MSSFLVCARGHLFPELVQGQTAAGVLGPGLAVWESGEMTSDGAGNLTVTRRWLRWGSSLLWAQPPVSKLCLAWLLISASWGSPDPELEIT